MSSRLPRELRERIYEYTFTTAVFLPTLKDFSHDPASFTLRNDGLLLTCRQVYHEAERLYYSHSIFHAPPTLNYDNYSDCTAIWSAIPARRYLDVREVRFTFGDHMNNAMKRACLRELPERLDCEFVVLGNGVARANYKVKVEGKEGGERWETVWATESPVEE